MALLITGISGLAAVATYIGATGLGGFLDPSYSQVSRDISELTGSRAPNRIVLAGLYIGYNVILVIFAIALSSSGRGGALYTAGWILVLVSSLSGILQVTAYPMDTRGTPATTRGRLHIVLAGISSILSLAVTIVYGFAFRGDPWWDRLWVFSLLMGALIVLTAPFAAIGAARNSRYQGLFERVTIGAFMLWVVGVAASGLTRF